jgi:hypothetical protein
MGTEDPGGSNVVPITVSSLPHADTDRSGRSEGEPIDPGSIEADATQVPPTDAAQAWLDAQAIVEQGVRVAVGIITATVGILIAGLERSKPPEQRIAFEEMGADVPPAAPAAIGLLAGAALGFGLELGRWVADTTAEAAKIASPFFSFAASPRVVRSGTSAARDRLGALNVAWQQERPLTEAATAAFATALVPEIAGAVLDQLDLTDLVIERVDFERVIDAVDMDEIVSRIPIEDIVRRLDVEAVVERVDIQQVVDRVNLDEVASRLDLEAIIARIDIAGIASEVIDEIDLSEIIRESSGALAGETVEGLRVQGMNADRIVSRVVDRVLLRRGRRDLDAPGRAESELVELDPDDPLPSHRTPGAHP